MSDDIVTAAKNGNAEAFTQIYNNLAPAVLGYLRGKGVDDPEALTNDVFLAALPQLPTFSGGAAELRRFVFTVAHARMVDDTRRTVRRGPTHEYVPEQDARVSESAEDEALRMIESSRLNTLLNQLTIEYREVLLLRLVADLPLADVAVVMGKSPGSIKQLQRRALIALRKLLEANEGRHTWTALRTT